MCHALRRLLYEGTPYERWLYTCENTGSEYGMGWTPRFCPECGGRMDVDDEQMDEDVLHADRYGEDGS